MPVRFALLGAQRQRGVLVQAIGVGRRIDAAGQLGAGHQALAAHAQRLHDQVAAFDGAEAHPHGDVEAFAQHVHGAAEALQVHMDLGALHHEAGDQIAEEVVDQRGRRRHADGALRLGAGAVDDLLGGLGARQHGQALLEVFLAQVRDGEAARGTLYEAHAQPLFQQRDAAAEAGLGDVERAAGRGEPAVLDDLHEIEKVIQIMHAGSRSF